MTDTRIKRALKRGEREREIKIFLGNCFDSH